MANFDIENELRPCLATNEKLIWTGKPRTGILIRNTDIFFIPFSIFWAGFAIFWEMTALSSKDPFPFAIFGIPFVAVGFYVTIGRFFIDAKKRANTIYGLTQERIIIKTGVFSQEIKSLNIKNLPEITINQKADNSGTITFGSADSKQASMIQGMEWPGVKQPPRLEFIEDVKNVYDKIIELQKNNNKNHIN